MGHVTNKTHGSLLKFFFPPTYVGAHTLTFTYLFVRVALDHLGVNNHAHVRHCDIVSTWTPYKCSQTCLFVLEILVHPSVNMLVYLKREIVNWGRYFFCFLRRLIIVKENGMYCFCFVFVYLVQQQSVVQFWPAAGRPSAMQRHLVLIHSRSHHVGFRHPGWCHCRSGWGWNQWSSSPYRMNLVCRWCWCQRRRTSGWSWLM